MVHVFYGGLDPDTELSPVLPSLPSASLGSRRLRFLFCFMSRESREDICVGFDGFIFGKQAETRVQACPDGARGGRLYINIILYFRCCVYWEPKSHYFNIEPRPAVFSPEVFPRCDPREFAKHGDEFWAFETGLMVRLLCSTLLFRREDRLYHDE